MIFYCFGLIKQGDRKLSRSVRTAFFPVFRQARKRRCIYEETLAVLEVVAIYALKCPIDILFMACQNERKAKTIVPNCALRSSRCLNPILSDGTTALVAQVTGRKCIRSS